MHMRVAALTLAGLLLGAGLATGADEGGVVEGSGFSMFDTESIVGYDEEKVKNDPVCDRTKRPRIHKVEPDTVKPGDRITITGENFGRKECFRSVNFSKASKVPVSFKYIDDQTVEATVPSDIPAGMTFVLTITGSGSAQSKAVLVTK